MDTWGGKFSTKMLSIRVVAQENLDRRSTIALRPGTAVLIRIQLFIY